MYVEDYIAELNNNIVRIYNVDYVPLLKAVGILEKISGKVISWSIEDFECQAKSNTNESESTDSE